MVKKIVLAIVVAVVVVGTALWLYDRATRCRPPGLVLIDDPAQLDDAHLDLPRLEPETWVRQYIPERASSGFNLGFYKRRLPIIFDMQGRIVHSWPHVRAIARIRLDHQGRLAVIGTDNLIKEYDWNGDLIWYFQLPDAHDFPHHDLMRMENGNFLVLARDGHSHADYILEVNRDREVVWEWWYEDHHQQFSNWEEDSTDPTHTNSIRELPENRWFAGGDERFRPGNILVSSRSLSTIFIIDKVSGEVVWQFSGRLDQQHEAVMVPFERIGDGLIMVFNNGRESLHAYRRSLVEAINPVSGEVEWNYGSKYFFSSIAGTAQVLPSNNVLITSSHGGRAFEIRPGGRIVWEWTPPYGPMRLERLAYDHCPQLAALTPKTESPIQPDDPRPFVDADKYRFVLPEGVELREIAGKERKIVPQNTRCRKILIPPDAILRTEYGIDRDAIWAKWIEGRFMLSIRGQDTKRNLVDANLGSGVDTWTRSRMTISLDEFAYQRIMLCISASVVEGDVDGADQLVWGNPVIESTSQKPPRRPTAAKITEQERRLREQQLKALGYVD